MLSCEVQEDEDDEGGRALYNIYAFDYFYPIL